MINDPAFKLLKFMEIVMAMTLIIGFAVIFKLIINKLKVDSEDLACRERVFKQHKLENFAIIDKKLIVQLNDIDNNRQELQIIDICSGELINNFSFLK